MPRPIPESIGSADSCPITLEPFDIGYAASVFDGAVTELGTGLGHHAEAYDAYSWRSGGDLWDYRLECQGDSEHIEGFLVGSWTLSRQPVGADEGRLVYYLDAPGGTLQVLDADTRREPTFREVNGFYNGILDLQAEIQLRRQEYRYRIVGGMVIPNSGQGERE